jgi:branched-chain amino acid transport system substrate-binding protein
MNGVKSNLSWLAIVGAIGLAACGGSPAPAQGGTVTIGLFVSTSGNGAVYGVDQQNGANLAVTTINGSGGIQGRKITVYAKDTAYDKTQAQSVMSDFVSKNEMLAAIGPTSSAEAFAADPMAAAVKMPIIAISNNASGVPQISPFVHRITVPEDKLQPGVAAQVVKLLKVKKAAMLYAQNDPFATTAFKGFQGQLQKDGVTITEIVPYDSDKTVLFTPQLQRIKDQNPDILFVAVKANDAALILRQARQVGITVPVVGNLPFNSSALLNSAGDASTGVILGTLWDIDDPSAVNQKFVKDYRATFNREPSTFAATAYNAVYILKEALDKTKDFTRAGVQKGIESMKGYSYVGVPVTFVDVGDGIRDGAATAPLLLEYRDGKFRKLTP